MSDPYSMGELAAQDSYELPPIVVTPEPTVPPASVLRLPEQEDTRMRDALYRMGAVAQPDTVVAPEVPTAGPAVGKAAAEFFNLPEAAAALRGQLTDTEAKDFFFEAATGLLPMKKGIKAAKTAGKAIMGSIAEPAAPAILSRKNPTADDIAAIRARAQESSRSPWPTAEREVFSTAPEAYAETTKLVPQVSVKHLLPGPLPGENLPSGGRASQIVAHSDQIANNIADRLYPLVQRQDPLLKFYHTAPVIRGLGEHADMTMAEANDLMRNWAGQGAATSPRTQTPPNLRNSSHLLYERAQNNPFTLERFLREGNTPGYGMMGMHADLGDKFARGVVNPWKNPKPYVFRENWSGNLLDPTGDTHNIRSTLYEMDRVMPGELHPSFFKGGEKGPAYRKYKSEGFGSLDPGDINDSLGSVAVKKIERQSEYLPMVEPWYKAAQKLGIAPAEAQSGGWFSYGGITGLSSPPKTIVNLLNDQIADTARTLNVPPEKVVNWWARGKIPLTAIAGGAAMGSLAAPDRYRQ